MPIPHTARSPARLTPFALAALFLAGAWAVLGWSEKPVDPGAAQLLLTTREVEPGSSFELRLDHAVARPDEVGRPAAVSPLKVDPPVRGRFVWRSRRSGVFIPTEPLRLGQTYRFELVRGLRTADGHPFKGRLRRAFTTPPMTAEIQSVGWWPREDAPVQPRFALVLNDEARAAEVARAVRFVGSNGSVRARVEPVRAPVRGGSSSDQDESESGSLAGIARQSPTWRERFYAAKGGLAPMAPDDTNVANVFRVEPWNPLPPGNDWRLVARAGLHGVSNAVHTETPEEIEIGAIKPFQIASVAADGGPHQGRSVRIRFSKGLAKEAAGSLRRWVRVDPEPEGLEIAGEAGSGTVTLTGAFQLGMTYRLMVSRGLPALQPVELGKPYATNIVFAPLRPNVWMQAYDATQLATGRGRLELEAVNTPETRLRLKRLDEGTLIHTLRAYRRYLRAVERDGDRESAGPLDFDGVAGRTIADTNLATGAEIDAPHRQTLLWSDWIAPRTAGAFFVEADLRHLWHATNAPDHRVGPQSVVQLTDLGILCKSERDELLAWVFSHESGKPVAGVRVSVRTDENEIIDSGTTDGSGCARLRSRDDGEWILAAFGDDIHAERWREHRVALWPFHVGRGWQPESTNELFVFTDREAYRPGEWLRLKAIGRSWAGSAWALPSTNRIGVTILDPTGDPVVETNLVASASGSADWSYQLPAGRRGSWRAILTLGDVRREQSLEVRDFQPATFEVKMDARGAYGPDESLRIGISARYLFGDPLSRASVHWSLASFPWKFAPAGWDRFHFGEDRESDLQVPDSRQAPVQPAGFAALTNGAVTLGFGETTNFGGRQPRNFRLLAEVTDLNQQTLSRAVEFVRHSSSFYLGFHWKNGEETIFATNQAPVYRLVAVAPDGTPVEKPAAVEVVVRRIDWKSVRFLGAGGALEYRNEPTFRVVGTERARTQRVSRSATGWDAVEDSDPELRIRGMTEPGEYLITFLARDDAGHAVTTSEQAYVTGDGKTAWNYRNGASLELTPDRTSHQVGDVATVLVQAPFGGLALVTVEREKVRRSFLTRLEGNAPAVKIPLLPGDAPNVVVGVTLLRGRAENPHEFPMPEWRNGFLNLPVAEPADHLKVSVEPSAPGFEPGAPVAVTATVVGARGDPVAGAEVALYAVDEGYLALTGAAVPDPYEAFHQSRSLAVETSVSLGNLFPENPELQEFVNKGAVAGGGGRLGLARSHFEPCPLWQTALLTDGQGRVRAEFKAPDSLTRYRLVAVATRGANQSGSGSSAIEIRKPLMIEPAAPRFAHIGDILNLRAVVFNRTAGDLVVKASLEIGANAVQAWSVTNLSLAPGAATPVDFPAAMRAEGNARLEWRVVATAGGAWRDDAVTALAITHSEPGLRDGRSALLTSGSTNLLDGLDPQLFEGKSEAVVRLSETPLAVVATAASRLLTYPYGCVEQTSSSLLPWLALRDFPELLPPDRRSATNFAGAIAAGVERLWTMQLRDGGLSYWPGGDQAQRWGSAYGALVLAVARTAGVAVATNRFQRLQAWLAEHWRDDHGAVNFDERCLIAAALAAGGAPDLSLHDLLLESVDRLSGENRGLLAFAMARSGSGALGALKLLNRPAGKEPAGPFGNAARAVAIRLLAADALADESAAARLASDLVERQRAGAWETTQGNAWSLWAVSDFARRIRRTGGVQGRVMVAGQPSEFQLGAGAPLWERRFGLDPAAARGGVILELNRPGAVFAGVEVRGRPEAPPDAPAVDHGFSAARTYARLDDANIPHPTDRFRLGDRVLVTLEINADEDSEWVAVEDPLPSIFEAVQGAFKTEETTSGALPESARNDFLELQSDRVLMFRDLLPEGRHTLRYLARVRAAGSAVAGPVRAEAMYQPSRYGLSGATRVSAVAVE